MEGIRVVGAMQGVWVTEVSQKLKQNVKFVYSVYRFPVENVGFNEYRSRAWTVHFANTQFPKKILKIQWGVEPPEPSHGYASGYALI